MDRAVSLAPDNVAVRVPRATGLLPFARGMRKFNPVEADRLTRTAIGDFEFVVATSAPWWSKLNEHGRGELLGALADGWLQLGDVDKARPYLVRQLSDHKAAITAGELRGEALVEYSRVCGELLAKCHARTGDALALAAYCGHSAKLDEAMARFALAYAEQTEKDFAGFKALIKNGTLKARAPTATPAK